MGRPGLLSHSRSTRPFVHLVTPWCIYWASTWCGSGDIKMMHTFPGHHLPRHPHFCACAASSLWNNLPPSGPTRPMSPGQLLLQAAKMARAGAPSSGKSSPSLADLDSPKHLLQAALPTGVLALSHLEPQAPKAGRGLTLMLSSFPGSAGLLSVSAHCQLPRA